MAKVKPTYEELPAFLEIAKKLVDKFPDIYPDIALDDIRAVAINNKNRADGAQLWNIVSAKEPISMYCSCTYCVIVYLSDWTEMCDKLKNRLVAAVLFAIPSGDNEGKINTFDLKDFTPMVKTFGVDYFEDEEGPDPLGDGFKWSL